jgi:hypothetical protein
MRKTKKCPAPTEEPDESARGRYFGTEPLWFWSIDDNERAVDRWLTHPFETRDDWCQVLDRLVENFEIDDRTTLKKNVEVAARIYNHNPDKLSKDDLSRLIDLTPKVAGALRKNAIAIENIITNFDQQQVRGFEPEFCKSAYDQSEADAFMTRIWRASDTLIELARLLSQHSTRGRPPNVGLHGAVTLLQDYWVHELGRKLKADPWKGGGVIGFLEIVFEFIDPAAVSRLPSAMKRRVRGLDKITR